MSTIERSEVEAFLPLTAVAFEILLSVAGGALHGYAIMLAIEERTGGRLSLNPGTLYRALDRLVTQGLLERVAAEHLSGDEDEPGTGSREGAAPTNRRHAQPRRRKGRGGAERHKFFRLSVLGARVAEAEAARLADQVSAARARALLGRKGAGS